MEKRYNQSKTINFDDLSPIENECKTDRAHRFSKSSFFRDQSMTESLAVIINNLVTLTSHAAPYYDPKNPESMIIAAKLLSATLVAPVEGLLDNAMGRLFNDSPKPISFDI